MNVRSDTGELISDQNAGVKGYGGAVRSCRIHIVAFYNEICYSLVIKMKGSGLPFRRFYGKLTVMVSIKG